MKQLCVLSRHTFLIPKLTKQRSGNSTEGSRMHVKEGKAPFYFSVCQVSSPVLITVGNLVVPPIKSSRMASAREQRKPLWFPYPFFIRLLVTTDGKGKKG